MLSVAPELLHSMKTLIAALLLSITLTAHGTMVVIDPSQIAQNAGNEVVNLAKYVAQLQQQVQTQLNTLNTYENTILQVARFGNPAALRNIPGVSTIGELYQIYGQLSQDVAKAQLLLNPSRYQYDMNSILASYQLPKWNGFTTSTGLPVLPGQGLFQFQTGSWNLANNAQQQFQTLDQQRQKLQQQRDQALSSLQSATDASQVQKYQSVVQALNAAIAEVSQAEQELTHRTVLQQSQLQAGQQIFQSSQVQMQHMTDLQTIDLGLGQLPSNNFRQSVVWGNN